MAIINILPSDSSQVVEYKIRLAAQVATVEKEIEAVKKYRAYYAGEHDLLLTNDQLKFLEGVIDKDSADWPLDNKCRKVVDKTRSRLNVTGWRAPDDKTLSFEDAAGNTALGKTPLDLAVLWWVENDMDRWEGELYKAALRDGEAYLLVDYNPAAGHPRFTFGKIWDGSSGIRMIYEDAEARQKPLAAIKYWYTLDPINIEASNVLRATVYTRDAVYKFARFSDSRQARWFKVVGEKTDDGYFPIQDEGDTAWPIPWRDSSGEPLGLAVVPFTSPRGSLLSDIIGINNALNKTNLDLLANADQQGFGLIAIQYEGSMPTVATGDSGDPAGDGLGLRPGSTLETTGSVTKLPADDMKGLLDFARHLTISIASNSDIPLHEFVPTVGEVPSGAALQQLGAGLAEHAEECSVWFTGSWRRVMLLAQRLEREYGRGLSGDPVRLSPVWKPVASRDEDAELSRLVLKSQIGVSEAQLQREAGYSEQQIEAMAAERAAGEKELGDRLLKNWEKGGASVD